MNTVKQRILSLVLVLILVFSVFTVPVSAATAKEVHTYLMNFAKSGTYESANSWWYRSFSVSSDNSVVYGVYYLEQTKYIEASLYTNSFEVTWRISSNPSPAYNAFIQVYDSQGTKGTVSLNANYNGSAFSGFSSFTGDTSLKSDMLTVLNQLLPAVMEFTRMVINENKYTLADLGMTGYRACKFAHAYDEGKVTKPATCGEDGVKTYTCRVCGAKTTEVIE